MGDALTGFPTNQSQTDSHSHHSSNQSSALSVKHSPPSINGYRQIAICSSNSETTPRMGVRSKLFSINKEGHNSADETASSVSFYSSPSSSTSSSSLASSYFNLNCGEQSLPRDNFPDPRQVHNIQGQGRTRNSVKRNESLSKHRTIDLTENHKVEVGWGATTECPGVEVSRGATTNRCQILNQVNIIILQISCKSKVANPQLRKNITGTSYKGMIPYTIWKLRHF